jgi:GDPmannose 4,6-dehydratase
MLELRACDYFKTRADHGITGQDGSYLAELLLEKGYEVVRRRAPLSAPNVWRIQHLLPKITLLQADMLDQLSLIKAVERSQPNEFYNLAAMSFVPASWDQPMLTGEYNAQGVTRALEAVRSVNPKIRFYQASSSENVRPRPRSAADGNDAVLSAQPVRRVEGVRHYITVNYRESYDLFACSGILFNHESPRRGIEFVTRKVTDGVARIKLGSSTS